MNNTIIGFCGFIGCGKDTAANYLVNEFNFEKDSFAKTLKDILSVMFNWDRSLLEGDSTEARNWRNKTDVWWSKKLGIDNFTPRYAMQHIGTNVFRNNFHTDIWVSTLENRLKNSNKNIVVSDVRFLNEIRTIKNLGGKIFRISRGNEPEWFQCANLANSGNEESLIKMKEYNIHSSEWSWIFSDHFDATIYNNKDINSLKENIKNLVQDHLVSI